MTESVAPNAPRALPLRPHLGQYRKQAKELVRAHSAADPAPAPRRSSPRRSCSPMPSW
ncbi:MAG: hypothetical protein HY332_25550 [Chloroflexi bacterium]|nr:hypothetical protein [Chloroflexota bacterium]